LEEEGAIMFDSIKNFIKGVMSRMFPVKTIKDVVGRDVAISQDMVSKIELWINMERGAAPWVDDTVKSLRLEKAICREFANICLLEMETSVSNPRLDKLYQKSLLRLNESLQSGLARGSFCVKPLGGDKVEYILAGNFVPVEFDASGKLIKVVFMETRQVGESVFYHRVEYHGVEPSGLVITNRAYRSPDRASIGKPVDLASVDDWAKLPESVTYPGMTRPDFGYYRNPIVNDIDGSPCGVSIYDAAAETIRKADIQFGRLDWEFESGERAVHVDVIALQPRSVVGKGGENRMEVPKLNKRLYQGLNIETGTNKELYSVFSPEFRETSIIAGLEEYKRSIEFSVSLSYGDLSRLSEVEKTATEVKAAKKRKYNMVTAIQKNLKDCLEDLVYALAFYNGLFTSGFEFVCGFKDSVLTDEEAERKQDLQDVAVGAMPLWEYRAKWYNEDEATARAAVIVEE